MIACKLVFVSWLVGTALATQDGSISIQLVELEQSINLEQNDASGSQHATSSFSVFVDLHRQSEFGVSVQPNPEITLPAGATGSISSDDFIVNGPQASYLFESAADDGLGRFPTGEFGLLFRAADDSCIVEQTFDREPFFSEAAAAGSARPNIRNLEGWKDGKLFLPKQALVIRWDRMGLQLIQQGDSEQENRISVVDNATSERVFNGRIDTVYSFTAFTEFAAYPHLLLGDQAGIDLSEAPGLVEGKTYTVTLSKSREQVFVAGDMEVESILRSQVSFQLYVDPLATAPLPPILDITTNDDTQMLSISWEPDPNFHHLMLDDLYVSPSGLTSTDGIQTLFTTPQNAGEKHVFTDQVMDTRGYYRVLPVPR